MEMMQGQPQPKKKKMVGLGVRTNSRTNLQIPNVDSYSTVYRCVKTFFQKYRKASNAAGNVA